MSTAPLRPLPLGTIAFYGLTAAKLASPLAIAPMMAHRLNAHDLGIWSICMSIASTSAVVIELGFGLSATREAKSQAAPGEHAIFSAVTATRAVAALLLLVVVTLAVRVTVPPSEAPLPLLVVCVWLTALGMGWSSQWFFQVRERLLCSAALDAAGIAAGLLLVAVWAHSLPAILLLNLATYLLPALLGHGWVHRSIGAPAWGLRRVRQGWQMTRELAQFRALTTAYNSAIPFLLATALPAAAIAPFFVAERVIRSVAAALIPFVQLMFPRMCSLHNADAGEHHRRVGQLATLLGALACVAVGGLWLSADAIAGLLAAPAIAPRVSQHLVELSFLALPLAVSTVLGNLYMLPRGEDRRFNRFVLAAALAGLGCALWLPRTALAASGGSGAILAAEAVITLLMLWHFLRTARPEYPTPA